MTKDTCFECRGSKKIQLGGLGYMPPSFVACPICDGVGTIKKPSKQKRKAPKKDKND